MLVIAALAVRLRGAAGDNPRAPVDCPAMSPAPEPPADVAQPAPAEPGPRGWLFTVVRDQRVAFLLVGAVNLGMGFIAFFGFDDLWRVWAPGLGGWHSTVVLASAHVATVPPAFLFYRTLVFRVRGHVWRDLARFESVLLGSLLANWALLVPLTEVAHLAPKLAQTIIAALQVIWSWFGHKYFSFRRRPEGRG